MSSEPDSGAWKLSFGDRKLTLKVVSMKTQMWFVGNPGIRLPTDTRCKGCISPVTFDAAEHLGCISMDAKDF